MAIVIESFQAQSAADLVTLINAYMATIIGQQIRGVQITATEDARTLGRTYRAIITSEAGGAAIAAYVLTIEEGQTADAVATALAAIVAGAPGSFYCAPRIDSWYSDGGSLSARCFAWFMSNTDAANAATDWVLQ